MNQMPASPFSHHQQAHALIVDDDLPLSRIIQRTLEKDKISCTPVHSLSSAQEILGNKTFDVVILDLNLPDGDGLNLSTLADGEHKTPTIVLSGRVQPVDTVRALEIGAEDFVKKPFIPSELLARVKTILKRHSPTDAEPEQVVRNRMQQRITVGSLLFDTEQGKFVSPPKEIQRLPQEGLSVLTTLLTHHNRVVSRRELYSILGWEDSPDNPRNLTTIVSELKRTLFRVGAGRHAIKYVYRKGYHIADA